MKKLLSLVLLFLIGCSEPEPLNYQLLVERDGVLYIKDTNDIYSGPVFNIDGKSTGYIKKGKWNGEFEFYHSNGQLRELGTWKEDKRDGPWKSYYENGQLKEKSTFKDGKRDGPWKSYYENGQLWWEETWKDGETNGPFKLYNEDGKLIEEEIR